MRHLNADQFYLLFAELFSSLDLNITTSHLFNAATLHKNDKKIFLEFLELWKHCFLLFKKCQDLIPDIDHCLDLSVNLLAHTYKIIWTVCDERSPPLLKRILFKFQIFAILCFYSCGYVDSSEISRLLETISKFGSNEEFDGILSDFEWQVFRDSGDGKLNPPSFHEYVMTYLKVNMMFALFVFSSS